VSFGGGIHYCLGAYLAKAELKAYLSTLIGVGLPEVVEAVRKETLTLRGFEVLRLGWTA
jgi:cytochrome P450